MADQYDFLRSLPHMSYCEGTKKGTTVVGDLFKVNFAGIRTKGIVNGFSKHFKCCVDWNRVMWFLLYSIENRFQDVNRDSFDIVDYIESVEFSFSQEIKIWMRTFAGFGLLMSLLNKGVQYIYCEALKCNREYRKRRKRKETISEEEDTAEFMKVMLEGAEDLFPDVNVEIVERGTEDECIHGKTHGFCGRSKIVILKLGHSLDGRFLVEKIPEEKSLANMSATVVANIIEECENEDIIEDLDIPVTLKDKLRLSLADLQWCATDHLNDDMV